MGKNRKAYLDTCALIAALDQSDSYHPLFKRLFADPPVLVTSPLVVSEGFSWFMRRYDTHRALQFITFIEDLKPLTILPIAHTDLKEAYAVVRYFSDQALTLADALGLYVMKKNKIHHCWSTDRHLSLTGIPLVIHEQ